MRKIAVLASGRGSNFIAISKAVERGYLPDCKIVGLLSHNASAPALAEAQKRKIPALHIPTPVLDGKPDRASYEKALERKLDGLSPDIICLAGYMRLMGKEIVARWRGKIINIHPSLLPAFPGLEARRQALDYGVRWTGCTVHFVTEGLDDGPILLQSTVEISNSETSDSLEAKMLPLEHALYVEALKALLTQPYRIEGRRVVWLTDQVKK